MSMPPAERYSTANRVFHWVTALMMLVILILGWIMQPGKDGPEMAPLWEWHKSLGVLVLFITAARIVWRRFDPPPPPLPGYSGVGQGLATATHILFFVALIWMPLTGYVYSTAGGHPPILFDLIQTPALVAKDKALSATAKWLHLLTQWPIYGLILLHLGGVFYHVSVRRDGLLDRMLPPQDRRPH